MGAYYNTRSAPLPAALLNGKSICFSPKTWTHVDPEDEGSEALRNATSRGVLKYRDDAVVEVPVVEVSPVPPSEHVLESAPDVEIEDSEVGPENITLDEPGKIEE